MANRNRKNAVAPQANLPLLEVLPKRVRGHGLAVQHSAPLVSRGKVDGAHCGSWRTSPEKAWKMPELQLAETPQFVGGAATDVDAEGVDDWLAARMRYDECGKGIPPPNWLVRRRESGGFHPMHTLGRDAVYFGPGASWKPIHMLLRFKAWCWENGADRGYGGTLCHNPMRTRLARGDEWVTEWGRTSPYTLGELVAAIPAGWRMPANLASGDLLKALDEAEVGERWFALRRAIGSWLGKPSNWFASREAACEAALELNGRIEEPLPLEEAHSLGAGIWRRHQIKLETGEQQTKLRAIQAARGRKGGGHNATTPEQRDVLHAERARGATIAQAGIKAGVGRRTAQAIVGRRRGHGVEQRRAKVAELRAQGLSIGAIADEAGCSPSTVRRDLKEVRSVSKVQAT